MTADADLVLSAVLVAVTATCSGLRTLRGALYLPFDIEAASFECPAICWTLH